MKTPAESAPEEDDTRRCEAREVCSQNVIHQTDQILRKLVKSKILQIQGR